MHIRKTVNGTEEKPRVYVFLSNKHLYVSAANDDSGKVLSTVAAGKNVKEAGKAGEAFGKKLKELGVENAWFDRSGYKFHLRLNAVVEGIRKSGISI